MSRTGCTKSRSVWASFVRAVKRPALIPIEPPDVVVSILQPIRLLPVVERLQQAPVRIVQIVIGKEPAIGKRRQQRELELMSLPFGSRRTISWHTNNRPVTRWSRALEGGRPSRSIRDLAM